MAAFFVASTSATAFRSVETHLHPDYVEGKKLGVEITELCAYIYAATYRLLVLIREFDEKELWAEPGLCSCAHWLNFKCGIGMNLGRHGTAAHVEKVVSSYRRAKRLQDLDTANEQHRDRSLDYYYDADGSLVIKGRFPAEKGALIVKALEMAMDQQFADGDVSAETPDRQGNQDDSYQREPVDARRADALAEVAQTYLNNNESSGSTADRYQVVVHVSAETSDAHIEDGPHVSVETSRRVSCDCSIIAVLENGDGEPLSVGRKTRAIPPAIRRALRFRDKGCRFPGCTKVALAASAWLTGNSSSPRPASGYLTRRRLVSACSTSKIPTTGLNARCGTWRSTHTLVKPSGTQARGSICSMPYRRCSIALPILTDRECFCGNIRA